jgi:hypothetical protein
MEFRVELGNRAPIYRQLAEQLLRTRFSDPNRLEFDVRQNGGRELNGQEWGKAQRKNTGGGMPPVW